MIRTNAEYMSDPARAARVVRRFMDMTLGELSNTYTGKYIKYVVDEMIRKEYLSPEKVQDMTYLEFACLIDSVGGNPGYDCYQCDSLSRQLIYYKMAACILAEGSKYSIPVKLFSVLPLKAFYTCLERASAGRSMLLEFAYVKQCCRFKEGYTVKNFICEKLNAVSEAWSMAGPVAEYEDEIVFAHRDMGTLLIDSFRKAFPDKFDAEAVCRKYRHPSVMKKDGKSYYVVVNLQQADERQPGRKTKEKDAIDGKAGN